MRCPLLRVLWLPAAFLALACAAAETGTDSWEATLREIRHSDLFAGLELEPIAGLVPLGRDPDSGLFEFWHVESGARPVRDATTGRLRFTQDSGIVLVLIPGGRYWMGSQDRDPEGPNYEPTSGSDEDLIDTVVEPFFLSKYEFTQGQWLRLTGSNPSYFQPGKVVEGQRATLEHPVESVSRTQCGEVLHGCGLVLPTEAQWEYACRAGTSTAWWTGAEISSLQEAENVADRTHLRVFPENELGDDSLKDDHATHAPVGSFQPNPFGIHDMAGNVSEWCADEHERGGYVTRGGNFLFPALIARSAFRNNSGAGHRSFAGGCRPARPTTERIEPASDLERHTAPLPEVDRLLLELRNGRASTRATAANQLGHLGAMEAIPALREALADPDPSVLRYSILALGDLSATQATPDLRPFLEHGDAEIRLAAVMTLLHLGDTDSYGDIVELGRHCSPEERRRFASLLSFLEVKELEPLVLEWAEDEDESVRSNALYSLARIGGPSAARGIAALTGSAEEPLLLEYQRTLACIDPERLTAPLRSELDGDNPEPDPRTLRALARIRDPKAKLYLLANHPASTLLNFYLMPAEELERIRTTRIPLRDIRWIPYSEILQRLTGITGIPIDFSPNVPVSPGDIRLTPNAAYLGVEPTAETLLGALSFYIWSGLDELPDGHLAWVYDAGKIAIATEEEAEEFFRRELGE